MLPKKIGCFINYPEALYQQRVLTGLIRQCRLYDYDLLVFSAMTELGVRSEDYAGGEFHIFSLPDLSRLDALIIVDLPMHNNMDFSALFALEKYVRENCTCPVYALDLPMGDFPTICMDDTLAFREITAHMLDTHHMMDPEKWYVLQGNPEFEPCKHRLEGIRLELTERGLTLPEQNIFTGDFWYTSGKSLAERILNKELPQPEVIISLSDYMAIGLVNTLTEGGIRVPEDIKVIAYDGTLEADINDTPITTYIPRISLMAQYAVNRIRRQLEPARPLYPADDMDQSRFSLGGSCGCTCDMHLFRQKIRSNLLWENRDFDRKDIRNNTDLWNFLQSYMAESLTLVEDLDNCLVKISEYIYLLTPFDEFSLCLRPDWNVPRFENKRGYPARMRQMLHATATETTIGQENSWTDTSPKYEFDTADLLPELYKEHSSSVYYFMPLHYGNDSLGYSVIKCRYEQEITLTSVHRHFMRHLNNSMQTVRAQTQLKRFSYYDGFTGLYNRRGMDRQLALRLEATDMNAMILAYVIDMDGLKYINDSFGHQEGDTAIRAISESIEEVTDENEIAIRAGGDEFYLLCIGDYTEQMAQDKADRLLQIIQEKNKTLTKHYRLNASIGWCMRPRTEIPKIESILHDADIAMYRMKSIHKFG